MSTLQLTNITYQFADTTQAIFKDINLTFSSGEMSLIHSPSGSGKSTLLKIIAGFYPEYDHGTLHGNINFNQQNLSTYEEFERRKIITMMFQNPSQQFCMANAYEEFIFTLENLQLSHDEINERMQKAVTITKIDSLLHQSFTTLSGGEKQRVALAIIIAIDSPVILLDEPFANVDTASRKKLISLLMILKQQGKIIIGVDHDLSDYQSLCDQLIQWDSKKKNFIPCSSQQKQAAIANYNQVATNHCIIPDNSSVSYQLMNFSLANGDKKLLNNCSINLIDHATTLISGANGCGKSTLFNTLLKQHSFSGEVKYQNRSLNKWRHRKYFQQVGLIFQDTNQQFIKITVKDEIDLSKNQAFNAWFSEDKLNQWIDKLGLYPLLDRIIYTLSQGQKRRLQILVMAIMGHPVLLLDEPFAGINQEYIKVAVDLLNFTKQHGQTQFIISHQTRGLGDLIDYHLVFDHQQLSYQEVF